MERSEVESVQWDPRIGEVWIKFEFPGQQKLKLTWQQFKFAVLKPVSTSDLIRRSYPEDWPPPTE